MVSSVPPPPKIDELLMVALPPSITLTPYAYVVRLAFTGTLTFVTTAPRAPSTVTPDIVTPVVLRSTVKPSSTVGWFTPVPKRTPRESPGLICVSTNAGLHRVHPADVYPPSTE